MCQFCHQHGEGKKWYLKAENYSLDLLNDLERRKYIEEFIHDIGSERAASGLEAKLSSAMRYPKWLRELGYWWKEQRYRRDHFGQVAPLEDIEQVLDLAASIVRLPCICRKASTGSREARYCIGLSLDSEKLIEAKEAFLETFRTGPHVDAFERISKTDASALMRSFEKEGLIHTIWTFKTPFIGAICNCDRSDCLAMLAYQYQFRLFFRGEYVGEVQQQHCIGCRACLQACQFGAIGYSAMSRRAFIDPMRCYGCGLCRSTCPEGAIRLLDRTEHPVARNLW